MSDPRTPVDWSISDELWAALGPLLGKEGAAGGRGAANPPRRVIHEMPVPADADPHEQALTERLLGKCRGNRRLLERLLNCERSRHPYLSRVELLARAIEHYETDNR
jgi:hypothetical protein